MAKRIIWITPVMVVAYCLSYQAFGERIPVTTARGWRGQVT